MANDDRAPVGHLQNHLGRLIGVFFVNALSLHFMTWILLGLTLDGWRAAIGAVVILAAVNAVVWPLVARHLAGQLLALDDNAVWRRRTIRRMVRRLGEPEQTDVPGVLFVQIDGLSESVLRRAVSDGYLATAREVDQVRYAPHHWMGV